MKQRLFSFSDDAIYGVKLIVIYGALISFQLWSVIKGLELPGVDVSTAAKVYTALDLVAAPLLVLDFRDRRRALRAPLDAEAPAVSSGAGPRFRSLFKRGS